VFVNLKGLTAASATSPVSRFAAAFGVREEWALPAIPQAVRAYHKKMKRPAVIIIEDAQGALRGGDVELMLAELAKCADAKAANLVFLSSEGDLPGQLRTMSGWSTAVLEYELAPIDEVAMTKHLQEVWKLDEPTACAIVDKVGTATREVFNIILGEHSPGQTIAMETVGHRVNGVIEQASNRITGALRKLPHVQFDRAAASRSTRRAAVLLLDRLTIAPSTSAHEVMSARGMGKMYPDVPQFEDAVRTLIKDNVLHKHIRGGQVAWHRRALRTAWQAAMEKGQYDDVRKAAPGWIAWAKFLVAG
jgi:hypothetical protein